MLELLPLPSPSTNHWLYAQHSELAQLSSREIYRSHYAAKRAAHIRQRVKEHRPEVVVFYGKSYKDWWQTIAAEELQEVKEPDIMRANSVGTLFIVTKHPVAMGVTNGYFQQIGQELSLAG